MPKHYRIVTIALILGLILALMVIFFIPEEIPGGRDFFSPGDQLRSGTTPGTDAEVLQELTDELSVIDQEYNFSEEVTADTLESPEFTVDSEGEIAQ